MKITYTKYKGAPLATVCSFLGNTFGTLMAGGGVLVIFSGEIIAGLVLAAMGAGLVFGASALSEKMAESTAFRKWWKQIEDAKLEPEIAKSIDVAVMIYKKNPRQRTLNKISKLNPAAGEYIRKNLMKQTP